MAASGLSVSVCTSLTGSADLSALRSDGGVHSAFPNRNTSEKCAAASAITRSACWTSSARIGMSLSPKAVGMVPVLVRTNSSPPTALSIRFNCAVRLDWGRLNWAAALEMLPSRSMVVTILACLNSTSTGPPSAIPTSSRSHQEKSKAVATLTE
ncbi:hypothetical protein AMK13_14310 [Streptomyces sp. CB02056]|nr:hypothetical protein AMK13_14310 [Streptomyces sp. CB02056]